MIVPYLGPSNRNGQHDRYQNPNHQNGKNKCANEEQHHQASDTTGVTKQWIHLTGNTVAIGRGGEYRTSRCCIPLPILSLSLSHTHIPEPHKEREGQQCVETNRCRLEPVPFLHFKRSSTLDQSINQSAMIYQRQCVSPCARVCVWLEIRHCCRRIASYTSDMIKDHQPEDHQ
jgi:hypothetical protein